MNDERVVLPPCDGEVFKHGESLLACDTHGCGAMGFEEWVKRIREDSGQRVDWHYSGGIAHVLYIGDPYKVTAAIMKVPCPARIMREYKLGEPGLYRNGVTVTPEGAIAGYYDGGPGSGFIVERKKPECSS
jgi:hypothetical protein